MKIVIIGTGNVATVFGNLLVGAGHQVVQVFGQTAAHAATLAAQLNTGFVTGWQEITGDADLYVIALSDKALYEPGLHLRLPGKLVVHTAGSVSMNVLAPVSENHGVLYPLQSLKKSLPVLTGIPLLVNAANELTGKRLLEVARSISGNTTFATDAERLRYHVAAVFINNFTNHLYAVAEAYCVGEGLEFSRLLPLATETVHRLPEVSPALSMTGPAVRGDSVTVREHLQLLNQYPRAQELYAFLTESIQRKKREK